MLFSPEERDRSIALWERHIRPNLGARECNQFVTATEKPSNWFVDTIIKPSLFLPGNDGGVYYPVDFTAYSEGRNHRLAQRIAEEPDHHAVFDGNPFNGLTYFANPLRLDLPVWDDVRRKEVYIRPMHRIALGQHQVFTFEFDVASIEFLKFQLSWLRSSGNWRDSPMGELFAYCSGFADFIGITVNYSGHKSLHIHIVFDTDLALRWLGLSKQHFRLGKWSV